MSELQCPPVCDYQNSISIDQEIASTFSPVPSKSTDKALLSTIGTIMANCRDYARFMTAEKSIENQARAVWLSKFGREKDDQGEDKYDLAASKPLAKAALAETKKLVSKLTGRVKLNTPQVICRGDLSILALTEGISPIAIMLEAHRASIERLRNEHGTVIEEAARTLPIWPWAEAIPGIGALSLGLIVGALGAPAYPDFANPAKVWKRLCLAVLSDGKAQRRVKDATLAAEAGFSPRRRAIMYNVGESLMKLNKVAVEGPIGEDDDKFRPLKYRQIYLDRKAYEIERRPIVDEAGKKVKGMLAWNHKRALRYMTKRFLVDLWTEWKRVA